MNAQQLLEALLLIPEEERKGTEVYLLPTREDAVLSRLDRCSPKLHDEPWIELR